jgi:RimJ/RimL family protein N-acetyltransferase
MNSLTLETRKILIGMLDGQPFGVIRYDWDPGDASQKATISINLGPEFRSRGLGPELLRRGSKLMQKEFNISIFVAEIKPHNTSSIRAFTKAGFKVVDKNTSKIVMNLTIKT